MQIFDSIEAVAIRYDETYLERIESFDSFVLLGKHHVFKVKKTAKLAPSKEKRVLDYIHTHAPSSIREIIPHVLDEVALSKGEQVTIQKRLPGNSATSLSKAQSEVLATAITVLHDVPAPKGITEFEGSMEASPCKYITDSADRFVDKLAQYVDKSDLFLVNCAKNRILERVGWFESARLVIVHKDLFLANILFEDDQLSAIVDWDAAQTAPPEWEHAILRQRFPEVYPCIRSSYKGMIDDEGVDLCALLQALRFWKSFPNDLSFSDTQRKTIKVILENG